MKNTFAFNDSNDLVNIDKVDKKLNLKYSCCNCGSELIPKKGKIKQHHFSHKQDSNCSYESYLHKVAKLKFLKAYNNALKHGNPFFIEYKLEKQCSSCFELESLETNCQSKQVSKFDLTKRFNKISIEKKHKNFIADILLESTDYSDKIFIEIAVTHECEKEKIESGLRIVEVSINSENDLKLFDSGNLNLRNENFRFYNFKTKIEKKQYRNPYSCNKLFKVYLVLKSGKAIILDKINISKVITGIKNQNYVYYKIIKREDEFSYQGDTFIELTREASHKGVNVHNCFACKFSAINTRHEQVYPLWCKRHKAEVPNSNDGIGCTKFWRLEKPTHNIG